MRNIGAIALLSCFAVSSTCAAASEPFEVPLEHVRSVDFLGLCISQMPELQGACEYYLYGVYWTMIGNSTILLNAKWNKIEVPNKLHDWLKSREVCGDANGTYVTPRQIRLAWVDWLDSHNDQMQVSIGLTAVSALHDLYPCK